MHKEYKPIKFPADESVHNNIIEWWYFNGQLKDKKNNQYSYMSCLFRVDVKRVKIPFLSKIPLKISYFSHSLITDLANKKFYHRVAPFSLVSGDSFSKPLLYINYLNPEIKNGYVNCAIEKIAKSKYHLKNEDIDLILTSVKEPLLEGGNGYLDLYSNTTYYYSLTNLKTTGRIKIDNQWLDVSGKSWMDHQWMDAEYSNDKWGWNWFSIQLDNNIEMVCCEYNYEKVKTYFADISYADGHQEHYQKINLTPLEKQWTSPKSKATYPLAWKIKIPEKNIKLKITTKIDNQEMLFGSINYWEGPLSVQGNFNGEKVTGVGFMELVGYSSRYTNIKYLRDEIGKTAKQFLSMTKDSALNLISDLKKNGNGEK